MGTWDSWAALRTVEACRRGAGQHRRCLAVSGSKLVSGSWAERGSALRVLEVLDLEQTLAQTAGTNVGALVALCGEV